MRVITRKQKFGIALMVIGMIIFLGTVLGVNPIHLTNGQKGLAVLVFVGGVAMFISGITLVTWDHL